MALIRFAAAAQLVVLSSVSFAADRPASPDRPGVAPSAFYMGVQGGVVWAQDKVLQYSNTVPLFRMDISSDAAFGGLHVGYQRVIDNFVVALEADYDLGGKEGKNAYVVGGNTFTRTYQMDFRSTLRARLGYDFGSFAVYATGGGALTTLKNTATASSSAAVASGESFAFGAAVGAGVVYKLSRHWAVFSEYRYADFGVATLLADPGLTIGAKAQHRVTETSVRAGATYYFR